ncbi:hypothetical protein IDSA_07935 [Pseudidiomarina salinarum]|uniref:Uncharacterized protein n=1 Tax=Pseudidiomarina salinarum TaxID=435908 RepID=A0A094JEJ8_9GAMM|nr:hypothetical protein [Pseudidiomarina salinarum]KFZ30991.1 hypothetical protein IDSA_07935 [Pseudidiomarina salinarum]RUO71475.1 hypothetical protein CWI79_08630 [Pseudidiomarina salinarum]
MTTTTNRSLTSTRKPLLLWTISWLLILAGSQYLLNTQGDSLQAIEWLVIILPSLIAIGLAKSYWNYLSQADELARAIELKALAAALIAGFIVWPVKVLAEQAGWSFDGWPNPVVVVMVISYLSALVLGWRAYR